MAASSSNDPSNAAAPSGDTQPQSSSQMSPQLSNLTRTPTPPLLAMTSATTALAQLPLIDVSSLVQGGSGGPGMVSDVLDAAAAAACALFDEGMGVEAPSFLQNDVDSLLSVQLKQPTKGKATTAMRAADGAAPKASKPPSSSKSNKAQTTATAAEVSLAAEEKGAVAGASPSETGAAKKQSEPVDNPHPKPAYSYASLVGASQTRYNLDAII
jgi:hypothetical protein